MQMGPLRSDNRNSKGGGGQQLSWAAMSKGTVTRNYLRPESRLPVKEVPMARAVEGQGLAGDHAGSGRRQVTMLDQSRWRDACNDLGTTLDPGARRANLVLEGVDLRGCCSRRLRIGDAVVEVLGETRPCELLDRACEGLGEALVPDWRGGAYGRVLEGGEIRVGDAVLELEPD